MHISLIGDQIAPRGECVTGGCDTNQEYLVVRVSGCIKSSRRSLGNVSRVSMYFVEGLADRENGT